MRLAKAVKMFTTLQMAGRKLFLGPRLKRLRRDRGLNQSAMAAELGVSPSYLNHLERNQRPVTAGVLLRLAEAFDIDVKAFAAEGADSAGADQLNEIFADPMLSDLGVSRAELVELTDNAPTVADGIVRLYTAMRELHRQPAGEPGSDPRVADHARNLGARLHPGRSATISPSWRRAPKRWARRSATRCRSRSRCGGG